MPSSLARSNSSKLDSPNSARSPEQTAPRNADITMASGPSGEPNANNTPKRGAKACAACRKGKNRCVLPPTATISANGEVAGPCMRCRANGIACLFEQPPSKPIDEERIERLESTMFQLNTNVQALMGLFQQGANASLTTVNESQNYVRSATPQHLLPAPTQHPPLQLHSSSSSGAFLDSTAQFYPNNSPNTSHRSLTAMNWAPDSVPKTSLQLGHLSSQFGHAQRHVPDEVSPNPPHQPPTIPSILQQRPPNGSVSASLSRYLIDPSSPGVRLRNGEGSNDSFLASENSDQSNGKIYPALPKYRAARHPITTYGLRVSTAPSSNSGSEVDEDEDALPTASLTAPFEALAEAASNALQPSESLAGDDEYGRARKVPRRELGDTAMSNESSDRSNIFTRGQRSKSRRRRRYPPPSHAFPDVIEKGLVSESDARTIHAFYFEECNRSFPILDPSFDSFDSMRKRSPWCMDAVIATAAQRMPENVAVELKHAGDVAAEEAEGIARSSLRGPTVRKEGVAAMALLAAWSENGYLAAGHAYRMALDLGLHLALEKLKVGASHDAKAREDDDERDLVVSTRIYFGLYYLDYALSTGTGRPHNCHEELVPSESLAFFFSNKFAISSDKVLCANIELIACRTRITQMASHFGTSVDARVMDFARRASGDLSRWWKKWDEMLADDCPKTSYQREGLEVSLRSAQIFLASTVLKKQNLVDAAKMAVDAREIALQARDAAHSMLDIVLNGETYRSSLQYAIQSTFAEISFSTLLLLKLVRLFPDGVGPLTLVVKKCHQIYSILRKLPPPAGASRFAFTIKIAVERFTKTFELDLPSDLKNSLNETMPPILATRPEEQENSSLQVPSNLLPFAEMSDPNWVGREQFPEWLSNEKEWTFDTIDPSQGLDRLFLPTWSTQLEAGYMFDQ